METTMQTSFDGATFIQLWQIESKSNQDKWLSAMHNNIHLLQSKDGFLSMALLPSMDSKNIIVYAQWSSEKALNGAVGDGEVKSARAELDSHGEPDGELYRVDSVFPIDMRDNPVHITEDSQHLTFVNVWVTKTKEQQRLLLEAMKAETPALLSKPGIRSMAYHVGLSGERLAVYAQWDSKDAFDLAISNNAEFQSNRTKLAALGQPHPNTYRVESVWYATIPN